MTILDDKECRTRIYALLERKYSSLLMEEFMRTFKRSVNEGISTPGSSACQDWDKFLTDMGMRLSSFMTEEKDSILIKNPGPNSGFITIPKEVAQKILVLGFLP